MRNIHLRAGLYITFLAHMFLYAGNMIGLCFAIYYEPWYYGVMFCTFAFSPAMNGVFCAFTNLENYFRLKLGMEIIEDDALSFYLRKLRPGKTIRLY